VRLRYTESYAHFESVVGREHFHDCGAGGNGRRNSVDHARRVEASGTAPHARRHLRVPAAAGDKEDGECAVFYFGAGQGGSVQANVDRWMAQFEQPDGRTSKALAKTQKRPVGGFPVTTIDLTGTYTGAGGPMGPKVTKPGYRLLGGIVEAPEGPVFFKFTGPAKTVAANEAVFQKLLGSVKR
jgi:hypothetical protein